LYKRKRIQKERILIIKKRVQLITLKEFRGRSKRKKVKKKARVKVGKSLQRRYRHYSELEYNRVYISKMQ
jgi:hypothetical protein